MRSGRGKLSAVLIWSSVAGHVASASRMANAPATSPQARARGGRNTNNAAGNHFMLAARAQRAPPRRGPLNCASHTASVSSRVTLPVSNVAMSGREIRTTAIAVASGCRR